jgi:hypothetical protein
MDDQRLPLEQRIGSVRDGDTTDHGTPIGSTPLAVQPPRRPDMDDQTSHLLGGDNSQTPDPLGGEIVAKLNEIMYYGTFAQDSVHGKAVLDAADEIQRLRRALLIAASKLSTTDPYAMLPPEVLYEALLALADKETTHE